jgi:uncharacterized protein YukE
MSAPIRVPVQPAEQGMPRPYLLIDADLARQIVALDDTTSTRLLSIEAHLQALADRTSAIAEIQRDDHEKGLAGRVGALEARLDGVPGAEYDAMVDRMTAEITALRARLDEATSSLAQYDEAKADADPAHRKWTTHTPCCNSGLNEQCDCPVSMSHYELAEALITVTAQRVDQAKISQALRAEAERLAGLLAQARPYVARVAAWYDSRSPAGPHLVLPLINAALAACPMMVEAGGV